MTSLRVFYVQVLYIFLVFVVLVLVNDNPDKHWYLLQNVLYKKVINFPKNA